MGKERRTPRCWEVIGCGKQGHCRIWQMARAADKPCWEVVGSFDDYRSALNVCGDCLVFVLNQGQSVLSQAEIAEILATKGKNPSGRCCKPIC